MQGTSSRLQSPDNQRRPRFRFHLLVVGLVLLLGACGTAEQFGTEPSPSPSPTPEPTPTTTPFPLGTPGIGSMQFDGSATMPGFEEMRAYAEAMMQLSELMPDGPIGLLKAQAAGADEATLAAAATEELPNVQLMLERARQVTPPETFEPMHTAMLTALDQVIQAEQTVIAEHYNSDSAAVKRGIAAYNLALLTQQADVVAYLVERMSEPIELPDFATMDARLNGTPITVPSGTPPPWFFEHAEKLRDYFRAFAQVRHDMLSSIMAVFALQADGADANALAAQMSQTLIDLQTVLAQMQQLEMPSGSFTASLVDPDDEEETVQGLIEAIELQLSAQESGDPALGQQADTLLAKALIDLTGADVAIPWPSSQTP